MKIVCAPDSFKESMTAAAAAAAMARGVRQVFPDAEVVEVPLSDGGEGFLEALAASLGARLVDAEVADALWRPIRATFGLTDDGLAVIEMAKAAGLEQISPADRDIWASSTSGVGDLVLAALDAGARRLVIGLGGSATNDGGAGMLDALGVRYLDAEGVRLTPTPAGLAAVASVDASGLDSRLAEVEVTVASDVTHPLCGPEGASFVFGPQKGASDDDVTRLDAWLARLAVLDDGEAEACQPGAGAAGGLGYALLRHLGAVIRPGVDVVTEAVGLAEIVADADLVLTGEGSVDAQTLSGKTPAGVAAIARQAGVEVVILAGRVLPGAEVLLEHGVRAMVPIAPAGVSLPEAVAAGPRNLERAAAMVVRLVLRDEPGRGGTGFIDSSKSPHTDFAARP